MEIDILKLAAIITALSVIFGVIIGGYKMYDKLIDNGITDTETQQKAEVSNYLIENNNIKTQELNNKIIDIYNNIESWINPKENQKSYNNGDKCYYKNEYWVSTVDNNISEPDSLANTWINI